MVKKPNPRVAELMRLTGKTRLECAFIAAIESGCIDGDVVTEGTPARKAVSLSSGRSIALAARRAVDDLLAPLDLSHSYASTQVDLPKPVADRMRALAASIPDDELADDGRETNPHVTALYGIHYNSPDKIVDAVKNHPPVKLKFGKLKVFPANEKRQSDVVVCDVDSPDLHALRSKLSGAGPHTDTYSTYMPHATVAYVKPGMGEKYAGRSDLDGQTATIDTLTHSDRNDNVTKIPLGSKLYQVMAKHWQDALKAHPAGRTVSLSSGRTIALTAPLDLYRPDQPRDASGRFTADPGGNMRTQIRQHGSRADFHEKKAAAHRAKGNAKMAAAHEKLAASHRGIAQGLHQEHSLKYGKGPQPTADFVPGKKTAVDKREAEQAKMQADYEKHAAASREYVAARDAHIHDATARGKADAAQEGQKFASLDPKARAAAHLAAAKSSDAAAYAAVGSMRKGSSADAAYHRAKAGHHRTEAAKAASSANSKHAEGHLPTDPAARAKVAEGIRKRIAEGKASAARYANLSIGNLRSLTLSSGQTVGYSLPSVT